MNYFTLSLLTRDSEDRPICGGRRHWCAGDLVLCRVTMLCVREGQVPWVKAWADCGVQPRGGPAAYTRYGPRWADTRVVPKDSARRKSTPAQARWQHVPDMPVRVPAQGDSQVHTRVPTLLPFWLHWWMAPIERFLPYLQEFPLWALNTAGI